MREEDPQPGVAANLTNQTDRPRSSDADSPARLVASILREHYQKPQVVDHELKVARQLPIGPANPTIPRLPATSVFAHPLLHRCPLRREHLPAAVPLDEHVSEAIPAVECLSLVIAPTHVVDARD